MNTCKYGDPECSCLKQEDYRHGPPPAAWLAGMRRAADVCAQMRHSWGEEIVPVLLKEIEALK
jgi:hypothetical protein